MTTLLFLLPFAVGPLAFAAVVAWGYWFSLGTADTADTANKLAQIKALTDPTDFGVLFSVEVCEQIKTILQ